MGVCGGAAKLNQTALSSTENDVISFLMLFAVACWKKRFPFCSENIKFFRNTLPRSFGDERNWYLRLWIFSGVALRRRPRWRRSPDRKARDVRPLRRRRRVEGLIRLPGFLLVGGRPPCMEGRRASRRGRGRARGLATLARHQVLRPEGRMTPGALGAADGGRVRPRGSFAQARRRRRAPRGRPRGDAASSALGRGLLAPRAVRRAPSRRGAFRASAVLLRLVAEPFSLDRSAKEQLP